MSCAGESEYWRPGVILMLLHVLLLEIGRPFVAGQTTQQNLQQAASTFSLWSVQDRPTLDLATPDGKGYGGAFPISQYKDVPPIEVKGKQLSPYGYDPAYDTTMNFSKFTHLGCYSAPIEYTHDIAVGYNQDPNECLTICKTLYPNRTDHDIIVMVHKERCGCALSFADLFEADASLCNYYCKYYQTPICGGPPNYWGVFKEYDYQALTSPGAYDPWRYIFYSVVALKQKTLRGGTQILDTTLPERYFLHAVDVTNGLAQYQFQMELSGLHYGLQYDIDSSRLVALHTLATTGRMWRTGDPLVNWQYNLAVIDINMTEPTDPRVYYRLLELQVPTQENVSHYYLAISGASAILSLKDCYLFTQSTAADSKREMKDRLYIVSISNGLIINKEDTKSILDFKVLQLFANEKYGDITAIGPRTPFSVGEDEVAVPKQTYVYIARLDYDREEERHILQWSYRPNNPEILTDTVETTANLRLYPGVNSNDHQKNLSAIVYAETPATGADERAITVLEVNYRTRQSFKWCNVSDSTPCLGTIQYKVPYAKMYNAEPGIPLSLKAPQFVFANFTMEANSIIVEFDKATTKGALQVDENNDMVPDYTDYSTVPTGNFDCADVFSKETIHLLGPFGTENNGTYCSWNSDSRIVIYLPSVINISVGDQLFVKTNTIYAKPVGSEYSPPSVGGVQVRPPYPTLDPVIILDGATQVDSCTNVKLTATSSFNTGRQPSYDWELIPGTVEQPNPKDKTNSPFRVFNTSKIEGINNYTSFASLQNLDVFELEPQFLEPAAEYRFLLTLTSRWLKSTTKEVKIVKLSYQAPMVTIQSQEIIESKKPQDVNIKAVGTPSACVGAETRLAYRWECTSNNFNFGDHPDIVTNTANLYIPPNTLNPPVEDVILATGIDYVDYNFTINCYVDAPGGDAPERTATQTVTVRITPSQIYVVFQTESRVITKGDILVLDARPSNDPDDPTVPGETFKGNFFWKCFDPPNPNRAPCFDPPPGRVNDGTIYELNSGPDGAGFTCRQDIGNKISDGGQVFNAPLFDSKPYCLYFRGVVMFQTVNFTEGQYKFNVEIQTYGGLRSANQDVLIEVSDVRVPKIQVYILDPQPKYPNTIVIRLQGNEEGNSYSEPQTKKFYWNIFTEEKRSTTQSDTNDPNSPSVQDQFEWVNRTDVLNPTDASKFSYSEDVPTLLIQENVLQVSTRYKFRLIIHLMPADVSGYGEVQLETAGGKPRNGDITIEPVNATMDTPRLLTADRWTADDLPLSYSWGLMSVTQGQRIKTPLSGVLPSQTFELKYIQQGAPENNYTLLLYCDISTPYNAVQTAVIQFQSLPPFNTTSTQIAILADARDADGSSVLNMVDAALSADPDNPAVWGEILDIIQSKDIPPNPHNLAKEMNVITLMISQGDTSQETFEHLEGLIVRAEDADCIEINAQSPCESLAKNAFVSLGASTPGALQFDSQSLITDVIGSGIGSGGRRLTESASGGGRRLMRKYQRVNEFFTHRDNSYTDYTVDAELWDSEELPVAFRGRQLENHPAPDLRTRVVSECYTPFCDTIGIVCYDQRRKVQIQTCCDQSNPDTLCNDPPCWFVGVTCPQKSILQVREERKENGQDTWFDQWNAYEFPLEDIDDRTVSDWDRANAFQSWHPDIYKRRLMTYKPDASKSEAQMLVAMEASEKAELAIVRNMERDAVYTIEQHMLGNASEEISLESGDPSLAAMLKEQDRRDREAAAAKKMEYERNMSQRLTRIAVMRDTLAKAIIPKLSTSELKNYPSVAFNLVIGKTTNLSRIHPSFVFPPAFQVPADSPDNPTATNPVTGFAFVYVAYLYNVYYWSDSNPVSTQDQLMTLIALKANADDLDIHEVTDQPIRVFSDLRLFSNCLCLYWDRFTKNTAGGAWSTQGVSNDETACITTNLSDIGIFMDGRLPEGYELIDKATDWTRNYIEEMYVENKNDFVLAVLGMILFAHILLILLGYVMDETRRSDMMKAKLNSRYHYDGDGITGPMNVDDAIAYQFSDRLVLLALGTTWKVLKREHALISPIFYHEVFTRPQRMLCFAALVMGLMAMNATVQSRRGYMLKSGSDSEYIMSGVLSGLLTFPIYCGLVMMFSMRPMPVKKRLIKRSYNRREVDMIAQKRRELDHASNLMPPPGYLQLPPPPPGGIPHPPGQTNLMGAPPPLKLPPLPHAAPGGAGSMPALPPPPSGVGSLPGIPALPSLPTAPGQAALPPPPNYPPAAKNARAPPAIQALPPSPRNFKRGSPPISNAQLTDYPETHPLPATMIANTPNVIQNNNMMAIDYGATGATGETGGTSQRPLPIAMESQMDSTGQTRTQPLSLPEPTTPPTTAHPLGIDIEQELLPPPNLITDPKHEMMSNDLAATEESEPGTGMLLKTPRGGLMEIPANLQVNTAFIRGQPNQDLAPPFMPAQAGPGGFPMPGMPPPGVKPPPGLPPMYKRPDMPGGTNPPQPPPPKEDGDAFIRRIRLTYMDKVIKEHEKYDLLEDHAETGKEVKQWVFSALTVAPYCSSCCVILSAMFMIINVGVKFDDDQAQKWIYGSLIGLSLVLVFLELFRTMMMTLVELRKFENRKKAKAGHFLPRRVKKEDDKHYNEAPKPKVWKNAAAAPQVPLSHPRLDDLGMRGMAGMRPNMLSAPLIPPKSGLPLAPPPPPPAKARAMMDFSREFQTGTGLGNIQQLERGFDGGRHTPTGGAGTPTSQMSGTGKLGITPPGFPTMTPDQTLDRSASSSMPRPPPAKGPPTQPGSVSGATPQPVDLPPRGTVSPTQSGPPSNRSSRSLGALRQQQQAALSQQVKAGIQRHDTPPPPPGTGSRPQSAGSQPAPPPVGPPPVGGRRRPNSASKSPSMATPGTPPQLPREAP